MRIGVALVFLVQAIAGTVAAQPSNIPPPLPPPQHPQAEPDPGLAGPEATPTALPPTRSEPTPMDPLPTRPDARQAAPTPPAPNQTAPCPPGRCRNDGLSEGTALGLSIGGTAVSWTMIGVAVATDYPRSSAVTTIGRIGVVGAVLAPSFGHWYARKFATRGLGLRVAGAGFATLALLSVRVLCEDECRLTIPGTLLIAGMGFTIAGTIDDIATTPREVRRYNQRLYNVSIVPVVHRDTGGMSLAVTGRF